MRFVSSFFMGRFADKKNHYILYIFWGLVISSLLTIMVILLPGLGNNFYQKRSTWYFIPLQVLAGINMVVLGFSAWCLVTIRWSAIGTELRIKAKQYSGAVAFVSFIAFLPDAFFQFVKAAIQEHNQTHYPWLKGKTATSQLGNQYILTFALGIGLIGLLSGFVLWYWVYRCPNKKNINEYIDKLKKAIYIKQHKNSLFEIKIILSNSLFIKYYQNGYFFDNIFKSYRLVDNI